MKTNYTIGEDGTPYLLTPHLPPHPIGPPGDLDQAQLRIRLHQERVANGTLDWRVDWPDRMVMRSYVFRTSVYVWRRVLIDPITGKRGKPTFHSSKKEALE